MEKGEFPKEELSAPCQGRYLHTLPGPLPIQKALSGRPVPQVEDHPKTDNQMCPSSIREAFHKREQHDSMHHVELEEMSGELHRSRRRCRS